MKITVSCVRLLQHVLHAHVRVIKLRVRTRVALSSALISCPNQFWFRPNTPNLHRGELNRSLRLRLTRCTPGRVPTVSLCLSL
ncbi:unnamed protein product [Scytosiphon promiscuus]